MPADAKDAVRSFLAETGIEPTLNRILVYSALAGSERPLTARQVLDIVLADHRVNRVTVYRILELLAGCGAVNRIPATDGTARFCARGGRTDRHCHFHCTRCGEVQCVDSDALLLDREALGDALPMHVSHVELRLNGICARCGGKDLGRR